MQEGGNVRKKGQGITLIHLRPVVGGRRMGISSPFSTTLLAKFLSVVIPQSENLIRLLLCLLQWPPWWTRWWSWKYFQSSVFHLSNKSFKSREGCKECLLPLSTPGTVLVENDREWYTVVFYPSELDFYGKRVSSHDTSFYLSNWKELSYMVLNLGWELNCLLAF